MPDMTGNAAQHRRGSYTYKTYASCLTYDVVLEGSVSATPTFPTLTVAYTVVSGSHSNVKLDQLVVFYNSAGRRKGSLRVAHGTITNVSLPIEEVAAGTVFIQSGDSFIVFDAYELRSELVSATSALLKDSRIALSDNTSNPPPTANCGGLWAGFVDAGQSYATVTFDTSISFTVDPDSSNTKTYLWSVGDGTITVGSASTASITATFPVGFRHITLVVTDSGNSKTQTRRIPVWVHNQTTYKPLSVIVSTLSSSPDRGWNASFELPVGTESSLDNLPDGSLFVLWEVETFNGAIASYGSNIANRSHIKAVLYLVRDTIHIDPDDNTVSFDAISPLAILEMVPGLPQLLVRNASPSKWSDVKGLTINRVLHYLAYWHSSLFTYFDFRWIDGTDLAYSRISVEGDSIAAQLRDIANSLCVQVTCDHLGAIRLVRNPDYLSDTDRDALTVAYEFTTADMMEADWTREHRGSMKTVRGEATTAGTTTSAQRPVFSNAPGNAPSWMGTGSDTLAKQIVSDQAEINTRTGMHFARLNGLFNGDFVPKGFRLRLPDSYSVFEPSYRELIKITLPASSNRRGVSFSTDTRWTVEQVDVTYDAERGTKDVTLTLDHETIGVDGTPYTPPQESQNGLPAYPPLENQFPGLITDTTLVGLVGGASTIAAFCSDNKRYMTTNFENPSTSGGPTWSNVDLTVLTGWPGGTLLQFEVDAYSPKNLGTGTTVNGWICTTTHVMRITDIFGTPALTGIVALTGTSTLRSMRFERGVQNWGVIVSWVGATGIYGAYTTNGLTWTEAQITAHYDTNTSDGWLPGLWVSPITAGFARALVWTATGALGTFDAAAYETPDYGATWSPVSSPTIDNGVGLGPLVVPYGNSGATAYYAHSTGSGTLDPRLYRSVGASAVDISPNLSGVRYGPVSYGLRAISIPDDNPDFLVLIGVDEYNAFSPIGVFTTANATATPPTWATLITPDAATPYADCYISAANAIYLIGGNGAIAFSDGVSVDSRIGNIVTSGRMFGICGD